MAEQEHLSDEQVKELQEKLKKMSPEELKEFQKKQCIFCQIISGKIPSKKVYEDNEVIGILDINPASEGHVLVIPKEHYSIMPQIPDDLIAHIFRAVKLISNAALRAFQVQGTNIIVANGVAAGQKAQHFMVHIIPRQEEDGIHFEIPQKTHSEKELVDITKKLGEGFGVSSAKAENVVDAEFDETLDDSGVDDSSGEEDSTDLDDALSALSGETFDSDAEQDEGSSDLSEDEDFEEDDSHTENLDEDTNDTNETDEDFSDEESDDEGSDEEFEEGDDDPNYPNDDNDNNDSDTGSSQSANLDDIAKMFGAKK